MGDLVTVGKSDISTACGTGITDSSCKCSIEKLLKTPFSSLSFHEKLEIVKSGPPKQTLCLKTRTKAFTRYFSERIYDTIPWL